MPKKTKEKKKRLVVLAVACNCMLRMKSLLAERRNSFD